MKISEFELQKVTQMLKNFTKANGAIAEGRNPSTNCSGGRCSGSCTGSCSGSCSSRCKGGCYGACKGGCSGRAKRYI